jgi:signal transduction histidine kinase
MGVGLTIVRGFADAMGGSVEAARGAAGGLLVRLWLPAAPHPADEPAP